jgi:diguanylate cyclase (GGDEF)-like protein
LQAIEFRLEDTGLDQHGAPYHADDGQLLDQLAHQAFHDPLTGLPNRTLFVERLERELARAAVNHERVAVLFLDLDRFKVVNDSLGHLAGDQFLVQLGHAIAGTIRGGEHTLARLGGDEFAILLDDIDQQQDATRVVDRIFQALQTPFKIDSQELFATVSVGIAFGVPGYLSPEELLRDADTAMYQAKTTGKARLQIFDASMHTRALGLLRLEHSLRRAVEKNEFVLHYQPIVTLDDGGISGFESLVRWEHPERGLISPSEFVHLAEETGLIYGIGRHTMKDACQCLKGWEGLAAGLSVNVNLSGRQFSQPDLIEDIELVLRETGLDPRRLKLEITESVIMENPEVAVAMLHRLKALGTRLVIDDFGTGYSSLSYLLRFPADTLKIDRSFVAALGKGGKNEAIVGAIVSLGRSLEMDVVAEGVETEEQREILRGLGCVFGQGYLFSRPVAAEHVPALLAAR